MYTDAGKHFCNRDQNASEVDLFSIIGYLMRLLEMNSLYLSRDMKAKTLRYLLHGMQTL